MQEKAINLIDDTFERVTFQLLLPEAEETITFTGDVQIKNGVTYYYRRDYDPSTCYDMIYTIQDNTTQYELI